MIRGLHTCKPGNTPTVGQIKSFLLLEMGEGEKRWTKIKSESPDKGGQHYMIMSVAKTDYTDKHGNVSFNLELEHAAHPPQNTPQNASPAGRDAPAQPSMDSPRQFLMRTANLYNLCMDAADTVIRDHFRTRNVDLHEVPAWFQAIVSTLFIHMKDHGYVQHMSDKEQKPQTKQEPY